MRSLFNKKEYKIFFFELVTIAFFLVLIVFLGLQRTNAEKQTSRIKQTNSSLTEKIQEKQARLNKKASDEALSNSDQEVKVSALQVETEKSVKSKVKQLFPILLNYSSGKEYDARKEKSKPYLADSVLKSKNIFASDKLDKEGDSYIDTVGLHSKFKDVGTSIGVIQNNHVPVIVIVTYESWYTDGKHGIGEDVYEGQYNIDTSKFDKLQRLNNLFTSRIDNSN